MPTPALEAISVTKVHRGEVHALRGIDLEVLTGETMALIGESGSGKTTLLRMFNRLDTPTTGEVRVKGRRADEMDPIALRRHTGYVQQEGGLLPHWTVRRNVGLVPRLLGWDRARREERVRELLDQVGISDRSMGARYPSELSGGERQRVAFARALAADPDTVLLDEPFGALDARTRAALHDVFLDLKRRLAKTMMLVTHDLGEAFRLGDRVAVMKEGRVLQVGTPEELRRRPLPGYVAALLERGAMGTP